MSVANRVYQLLLHCYPTGFRREFGREMALVFRDERRAATATGKSEASFWVAIVWDLIRSAPLQRIAALREGAGSNFQPEGRAMKQVAIVTMLAGLLEAFNAAAEGWYGGAGARDAHSLAAGALGSIAGILLVVAAVGLLRRARTAAALVQRSAIACLVAIALAAAFAPRLSVFSTFIGIVMPVVLLMAVYRGRSTTHPA